VPTRVFSWYKYAIVFILTFLIFKLNIILTVLSTVFAILQVDGRYLSYLSDIDAINMTGLYMFFQFGLFSIARIAFMESNPQNKGLLNIWFLGILGHFLFSFSMPITRLTKYFDYFIILIMPYTIQYLNSNFLLQVKDKIYNFKWGYILLLFYMYTLLNMMSGIPHDYHTSWRNPYPSSMNIEYQFNFKMFDR
jgi:membrane protein